MNLYHAQGSSPKYFECICDVSGKCAIDFIDVRLNYNRESCSSSKLRIVERNMCNTTICFNKTYACTNFTVGHHSYFLETMYERKQVSEVTLSVESSTCPASMIGIKLRATGK